MSWIGFFGPFLIKVWIILTIHLLSNIVQLFSKFNSLFGPFFIKVCPLFGHWNIKIFVMCLCFLLLGNKKSYSHNFSVNGCLWAIIFLRQRFFFRSTNRIRIISCALKYTSNDFLQAATVSKCILILKLWIYGDIHGSIEITKAFQKQQDTTLVWL